MTPCEKLGYKVGDKFEVIEPRRELKKGQVLTLIEDDYSNAPRFDGEGVNGVLYMHLHMVKHLPKLTKSKQWLADAIHNHGAGWPNGAKWAAQGGKTGIIAFAYGEKPRRVGKQWRTKHLKINTDANIVGHKPQPNWHQAVLSREEYLSVYPESKKDDEDVAKSGPVISYIIPESWTLDGLMSKLDKAKKATQEAKQAEREAHAAVSAELKRRGWTE